LHTQIVLTSLTSMKKLIFLLSLVAASVSAQVPAFYKEADLKLGEKLMIDSKCAACHQQKVGGDGSAIYRPLGRVNTSSALLSMVERCSTELNLGLFPEDVASVAAVLNRDHYRFTK